MRKKISTQKQRPIDILFSKTRQGVLTATFLQADRWWYLSELAQHLGVRPSSLQAELPELESGELLTSKKDGNRIYYRANSDATLFQELQQILVKTIGLRDVIKDFLRPFEKKISAAFIFGSIARGEEVSASDVDLMIIGDVKLIDLVKNLKKAELKIGRPINPTTYKSIEFTKQIQAKNNFVTNVLSEKKIFIIGSENGLENLAKY